ncbi:uncharacterized protein LOC134966978 [Pseudophryne corroboree]|uniref:uncharacterized protein LOC134966978 n=1 Tax=Pseudophryne corroboree TaxID=495146 RepID=UPI003081259E
MITNQPSTTLSLKLRVAVAVMLLVSTLFLLIAISTNHWINANGRGDIEFAGLWNICNRFICEAHSGMIYAKVLLVCSFIFGFFGCAVVVLGLWLNVTNMKRAVGKMIIVIAILELAGMISATVFLLIVIFFKSVAYGLVLGWIAAVLSFVASCLSYYHSRIEPDEDLPTPLTKPEGENIDPPPPYMVDPLPGYVSEPPPSSIIVS